LDDLCAASSAASLASISARTFSGSSSNFAILDLQATSRTEGLLKINGVWATPDFNTITITTNTIATNTIAKVMPPTYGMIGNYAL
jgi:hypothetical protein